jgi:hypothetical protein
MIVFPVGVLLQETELKEPEDLVPSGHLHRVGGVPEPGR